MSGFRGGDRGRGGFRGGFQSRGGRGGYGDRPAYGPPASQLEAGTFLHACENELVITSTNPKIPYFNAPIFLENKTPIGKVDEIMGPLNQVYFTVKPQEGIIATSFKSGDKFFIMSDKLLPLEKFLPKPKPPPGASKVKKPKGAGGAGGARGGRGGFSRGGRGAPRGRGGDRGRGGFGGRGGSRGGGGGFGGRGGGFGGASRGAPRGRGGFRGRG